MNGAHLRWIQLGVRLLSAVALFGVPTLARAEPHRLVLDQRYRPFQWPDAAQTGVTLGLYAFVEFGVTHPTEGRWQSPILGDAGVRDALLAQSPARRHTAAVVSDVTWYVPMLLPWLEGIGLPLFTDHWNHSVAFQLTALNAQAVSVVALLTRAGHKFVARARPDLEPCLKDPAYNDKCFGGAYAGFPSGHVSAALVGAGLSCAHHGYLPLLGGGAADAVVCVTATAMGLTSGVARIAADRHYLSDVIAGAILGWGVGFAFPALLHYEWRAAAPKPAWTVTPVVSSNSVGLGALGLW